MTSRARSVAIIAGVGPGTGAAVARKFAQNYSVVLLARKPESYEPVIKDIESNGGKATGISTDMTSAQSVKDAFARIKSMGGEEGQIKVAAAIYNVSGPFLRKPFLELTEKEFDAGFAADGHGAFLFSQHVLPLLLSNVPSSPSPDAQHPPTLIFTGATAAMRGSAFFASVAAGKFALRALAQSLGREFGPKGIHVVHAVIDGVIDIEATEAYKIDAPDGKISADAIADQYWYLHTQPRTSFTNEIDIRPYAEKW